ncbi:MAG: inositol monophosphatase [Proteobacteria bacterium]|nr:inositol monophosphatase [Pseudomonadota bacterium]
MSPIMNIAVKAARRAATIILQSIEKLDYIQVTEKEDNDFVTEVDKQAEQIIIQTIKEAYPNHGILAEESGEQEGGDYVWIIDPLDGTKNFMHGFPHFSISIAVKKDNRIEHGLIYDPNRDELFVASRGEGARLNHRRLRVTDRTTMPGALLGTGFPFRKKELLKEYLATFEALFTQCGGVRRAGSAALDLAYVAAGRLDGFWEYALNPWDIAAGVLMIKEAGGLVADFEGGENYFESGNLVAANPKLLKLILQTLSNARGKSKI